MKNITDILYVETSLCTLYLKTKEPIALPKNLRSYEMKILKTYNKYFTKREKEIIPEYIYNDIKLLGGGGTLIV